LLLATRLAALLLSSPIPQAAAQVVQGPVFDSDNPCYAPATPCILPVASIFISGCANADVANFPSPHEAGSVFFGDPSPNFWDAPNGLFDMTVSSSTTSENMIQTSAINGVQAVPGGGAFVVDANFIYLGICCYWDDGLANGTIGSASYIRFQAKVEAAAWDGGEFADIDNFPGSAILPIWTPLTTFALDVLDGLNADVGQTDVKF
jgi:hypothetical protein